MKKEVMKLKSFISSVPLFKKIEEKNLSVILKISSVIEFDSNIYIIKKNEKSHSLYIIMDGVLEVQQLHEDGRVKTLAILKSKECFGEMGFFTGNPRSASVKTLQKSKIIVIEREKFLDKLLKDQNFMLNVISIISERLILANENIQLLTFKNLQGRVASELIRLSESYGVSENNGLKIDFPVKHNFLAELIGTSRETVTKILNQFKAENSIDIVDKYITIIDKKKLMSWG